MIFREGSIHHLPVAHPNDAIVCLLMAPGLHLLLARQCRDIAELKEEVDVPELAYPTWCVSLFEPSVRLRQRHNPATRLLTLNQLGSFGPNLPDMAGTQRRAYVCVVRNLGWVCASAARQLEMGSAASLKGPLHGSCVDYTAMARRLVWQQLTLDLSSPLPNSGTEKHVRPHTRTRTQKHTLEWHSLISYT